MLEFCNKQRKITRLQEHSSNRHVLTGLNHNLAAPIILVISMINNIPGGPINNATNCVDH